MYGKRASQGPVIPIGANMTALLTMHWRLLTGPIR
jgi:hypothetical protein